MGQEGARVHRHRVQGEGRQLDDEQSLVVKILRGIKENQAHVKELEAERQAGVKAER